MDGRFHLDVKFSIYGQDYKWKCSLNWSSYNGEVDKRITEWFLDCHDEAYGKYLERCREIEQEQNAEAYRRADLNELKRLREKYPEA